MMTDALMNQQDVSVELSVRGHRLEITGTLSWTGSLRGRTIQVLVPGYTYGRHYWDFPHRPDKYSYVRAAVEAGYATVALDRIGTGASSHPPAAILTLDAHVAALAAVVTALREGRVADTAPNRIVTVGHSLGSAIVAAHAVSGTLDTDVGPVDGSILTGFSHFPLPGTPFFFALATWPAREARNGERLPAGYRTTIPGTRRTLYAPGGVERDVLFADERLKETTVNVREVLGRSFPLVYRTRQLAGPLLVITGSRDTVVCGRPAWMRLERLFFGPRADVSIVSLTGFGHCLNTSPRATQAFSSMTGWCDSRVGVGVP
jgi:alpha-beta hydrolase superfamily lysophospholipase